MGSASLSVLDETYKAARDMSAGQYLGVEVSSDNTVDFPSAALTAGFGGVLQDKPAAAGRPGRVVTMGRTKAYLGATLTIGQRVYCAASGWFGKVTSGYCAVGEVTKTANSGYIGEIRLYGSVGNFCTTSVVAQQI